MRSLKKVIQRTKSYINIKTYKRPLVYVIILMVLLNLLILVIAAFIALTIDDSFDHFFDAFFNGSLKWMLTPNAILTITNPKLLALSVAILIIGLILFSGTIIALTTNAIKDYFQSKKDNAGKIDLDEHIVIINWNSKVPELVADLLYLDMKSLTIMIVSMLDKSQAENLILNALKKEQYAKKLANLNVLVKQADPLIISHLTNISIQKAKAVIIMNKDTRSDLHVIKNVLSLGPLHFIYQPPIVVEIKDHDSEQKLSTLSHVVKDLSEHRILPVCFDQRLGQIIAQTIIEERLESIYLSLFSFEGSEVYKVENQTFDDVMDYYSHAIPVMPFKQDVFAISLSKESLNLKQNKKQVILKDLHLNQITPSHDLDIYIIGKNHKLNFIQDAFKHYQMKNDSNFQLTCVDHQEIDRVIHTLNNTQRQAKLLLLSDETKEFNELDADIIESLIYLESHLTNQHVSIIVEILNPKHGEIISGFRIKHTIISNKIISLLLSKLALEVDTSHFYHELLTIDQNEEGVDLQEISIVQAKDLLKDVLPLTFDSVKSWIKSIYISSLKTLVPIGYYRDQQLYIHEGNLTTHSIEILDTDDIILMRIA
ncbi:MAG: hypothetical protein WC992_05605 [Acholeplasmataceae bacterium]|nr:hypothetical protein [Acholeplasmataceae bacterium]